MKTGLKIARACQLIGALCMVAGIVKCSNGGVDGSGSVSILLAGGFFAIISGKVYEFMTKP